MIASYQRPALNRKYISVFSIAVLHLLDYKISKMYTFDNKFNLANLVLAIIFSSIIILTDLYFKVRIF